MRLSNHEAAPLGMLIPPGIGQDPCSLEPKEAEQLLACLDILQHNTPYSIFLKHLIFLHGISSASDDKETQGGVMDSLISMYMEELPVDQEYNGLLWGRKHETATLSEDEAKVLAHTLHVFRLDNWFSDWLEIQLNSIAKNTLGGDVYVTPMDVADSLTVFHRQFDELPKGARVIAKERPELLFPKDVHTEKPKQEESPTPTPAASKHRTKTKRNAA